MLRSGFARKPPKARKLRPATTPAQRILWSKMRTGDVEGAAFRRQHAIGAYVLDFYCPALGLAIELDGGQHTENLQSETDATRDTWLRGRGIQVLRYESSDIFSNLNGVLEEVRTVLLALQAERGEPAGVDTSGGVV